MARKKAPRLDAVDLDQSLDKDEYRDQLILYQRALQALGYPAYLERRPVVLVFEGWDAAGKGGAIRRVTAPLDPRAYVVHPVGPPEGEDARRHYLHRFWRRLPEAGRLAIFDRSWYGRVLVERVEGFAQRGEWKRAYDEICDFEQQLVAYGTVILKFWMHVSSDEQLRRFREREADPRKRWKLTDEDWRNRERRDDYHAAVEMMLQRTHTREAPWNVIAGDDKRFARVEVLKTIVEGLSDAFETEPPLDAPPAE
jgi:polyphosphate kinase 2 (PPK2 family)